MKSVGVKFKKNGKEYIFDDNNNNVKINDYVIVETEKGQQFGYVSTIIENELKQKEYSKIIKIATKKEIDQNKKNIASVCQYNLTISRFILETIQLSIVSFFFF